MITSIITGVSRSTGIPVRGPKDLPVSRTAVPAVLIVGSTGETPVVLMGETPMPRARRLGQGRGGEGGRRLTGRPAGANHDTGQ